MAIGADLEPTTMIGAYSQGLFPMPVSAGAGSMIGWWSPDPRGIIPLDRIQVSRSLRRARRRFEVTVNRDFPGVLVGCADPSRPRGWIDSRMRQAYLRLHEIGYAHSIEIWAVGSSLEQAIKPSSAALESTLAALSSSHMPPACTRRLPCHPRTSAPSQNSPIGGSRSSQVGYPELVGGLFGIEIGGLFAGESMFHRRDDASKAAVVSVVKLLAAAGDMPRLFDVQWLTPHLRSLGAIEIKRSAYLAALVEALPSQSVLGGYAGETIYL